jgi:hypothetical protein
VWASTVEVFRNQKKGLFLRQTGARVRSDNGRLIFLSQGSTLPKTDGETHKPTCNGRIALQPSGKCIAGRDRECINTVTVTKRVILQIRETISFYMRLQAPCAALYYI